MEGKSGQIEIEGGIHDAGAPYIAINITENLDQDDYISTWWISDSEALELSNFLLDAVNALKRHKFGDIGQFYENDLSQKDPWLSIRVEQYKIGDFIQISLDDELVRESESDGICLLTGISATEFSELLRRSIQLIEEHPPHVYKIPEPENIKIAEIC